MMMVETKFRSKLVAILYVLVIIFQKEHLIYIAAAFAANDHVYSYRMHVSRSFARVESPL